MSKAQNWVISQVGGHNISSKWAKFRSCDTCWLSVLLMKVTIYL
jgi:hypothetical protein